jgi:hypothetical protein
VYHPTNDIIKIISRVESEKRFKIKKDTSKILLGLMIHERSNYDLVHKEIFKDVDGIVFEHIVRSIQYGDIRKLKTAGTRIISSFHALIETMICKKLDWCHTRDYSEVFKELLPKITQMFGNDIAFAGDLLYIYLRSMNSRDIEALLDDLCGC